MKLRDIISLLRANVSNLPASQQDAALSLCAKAAKAELGGWQLSEKQVDYIVSLAKQATGRQAPAAAPTIGGLQAVHAFMTVAAQRMKSAILRIEVGGKVVRLYVAKGGAVPGAVNVCADEDYSEQREWYGRVTADGAFTACRKFPLEGIAEALREFAKDPLKAAALFGQHVSRCCFCGAQLTAGPSLAAGYGPICAEHWGLAWGDAMGIKGGWRAQPKDQREIAEEVAEVAAPAPVVPSRGVQRYVAPAAPEAPVEPLNDPIDDLWVHEFTDAA